MPTPEGEVVKTIVESGPFAMKDILPTLWMLLVAAIGGVVSFIHKVKAGKVRAFNITELFGEIFTSAFVGLVTYWICKSFVVNEYLTAAGVAVTGHMGARAIFIIEQWIEKRGEALLGKIEP